MPAAVPFQPSRSDNDALSLHVPKPRSLEWDARAAPSWDTHAQLDALQARKRHEESVLAWSGSLLAVVGTLFLIELLSVNEDSHTFLVVGVLNLAWLLGGLALARRWTGRKP